MPGSLFLSLFQTVSQSFGEKEKDLSPGSRFRRRRLSSPSIFSPSWFSFFSLSSFNCIRRTPPLFSTRRFLGSFAPDLPRRDPGRKTDFSLVSRWCGALIWAAYNSQRDPPALCCASERQFVFFLFFTLRKNNATPGGASAVNPAAAASKRPHSCSRVSVRMFGTWV